MAVNKETKTTSRKTDGITKSKSTKTKPVSKKKVIKDTTPIINSKAKQEKGFLMDAADNIETGAKIVGERTTEMVSDLAKKSSKVAGAIFEKVKKGATDVYEAGSKIAENITETAQDYAEKYKHKLEIKKLIEIKNGLFTEAGSHIYKKYKSGNFSMEQLINEKSVVELFRAIKTKEIEIIKLGQELDKIGK
jgi:hypothetical protein